MPSLQYVDVPSTQAHTATVIWLHGLGDSGNGFAPIVPELKLPADSGIRFIFPHAPERPVTINNGMRMRAWYDITTMDFNHRADRTGVEESATQVAELIEGEIAAGISPNRIVLAGFSQGGVIALHMAARSPHTLAGVMALSTYMCEPQKLSSEMNSNNISTPIFMGHGSLDDVVPLALGKSACETLKQQGFKVNLNTYAMQHSVCFEELQDIRAYLVEALNINESA